MAVNSKKRLLKAIRETEASAIQAKMAAILLAVNGIDSALEYLKFVSKCRKGGF